MNDPQAPKLPSNEDAERDQFEQQLRSLAPRAARFQLTDPSTAAPLAASTVVPSVTVNTSVGRTSHALTLLATWSVGVAVGVLVTLAAQNPAQDPGPKLAIEKNAEAVPRDQSTTLANIDPTSNAASVQADSSQEKTQITSANPFAIGVFPWQARRQRRTEVTTLTAFDRSFGVSELDARFMQSANPNSRDAPFADASANSDPISNPDSTNRQPPIVPVKIQLPPPASQRDILQDLLDTYG